MFKGSFVALVTPFKNNEIDEKKLRELVDWHIAEGTNGLVPVGTTGEASTLSYEEHYKVIEIVASQAKKRVPVVAGAGSNSTQEAIELTREAARLGADAVLSVNPYYNKPTQEGLRAHFTAIAKASPIPVMLYNIPSRTNVQLTTDTIVHLAEKNANIVAVKEATGSMDAATEIIARLGRKFGVTSGDDSLTLQGRPRALPLGRHGRGGARPRAAPETLPARQSHVHRDQPVAHQGRDEGSRPHRR